MKKVLVVLASGFVFLFFASQSSLAQMCRSGGEGIPMMQHDGMGMMMHDHRGKGASMRRVMADLGLDEKQKEAIQVINSRVAKDVVRKKADLAVARIELRDILRKDPVDMAATEAALKKIASLQTDVRLARIKKFQEIKATLMPEQRKKWKEMREKGPDTGSMMHGGMRRGWPDKNDESMGLEKAQ